MKKDKMLLNKFKILTGQTRKMTYIDIIAEKTIDEKIVKALRNKMNIATKITGDELKEWI